MRLLIVEDEKKTADFLKKGFSESGIISDIAQDGEEGLQRALAGDYDLIVLDVMLPRRDGWSVISELRRRGRETPVVMLTARDAVPDRIRGLELGVDDYVVKPFSFSELAARIRTILRRGPTLKEEILRVADLEIDLVRSRASRGGKLLDLTPTEFALLSIFVRRPREIISKIRIAERVWNVDFDSIEKTTKIIDVHMSRMRAKLDDPFEKKLLHTVRGMGYILEER